MSGGDPSIWFTKSLSVNDTPERRGHQSAIVIPVRAGRRLYPTMNVGEPIDVVVVDPDEREWQCDIRWYAKGEYHLTSSDPILERWNLRAGDVVTFRIVGEHRFSIEFDRNGVEWLVRRLDAAGRTHEDELLADELGDPAAYSEGARMQITVNAYERDSRLRAQCIARHGASCAVCGLDFEQLYGEIGKGFIHVHHVIPASRIADIGGFDPVKHLVPVCPNCHAMLHRGRGDEPRSVGELRRLFGWRS